MIAPSNERAVDRFVELAERGVGQISRAQLDRGWQRIQDPAPLSAASPRWASEHGLPGRGLPGRGLPERGLKMRAWLAGFATASAVAALALVAYRALPARPEPALRYAIEGLAESQGNTIATSSGGTSRLRFSDESRIALGPSTNLTVEALDARGAQIGLADGALDVHVKPRANASWVFVAGPFRVNVKGTEFHLAFAADRGRLTLHMKSGLVEVLAPPNRTIAVGKNESLELFADPAQSEAPSVKLPDKLIVSPVVPLPVAPPVAPPVELPVVQAPRATAEPARHRGPAPASEPAPVAWSKLLAKGDFASVITDAERRGLGVTMAQASAADLSALADAARYTKRNDLARQVLLSVRSRFAGAEHARDASFFLGRLAEAATGRSDLAMAASAPAESALAWYETYLREAPRGLYASEALGREMALLAQNAPERARKVAGQYLARFPKGPQAELARSLLESE